MNPIATCSSYFPFAHGRCREGTGVLTEQTRAGFLSQTQNTDLTLTTDEGDTVTLSLASAMEVNAGVHRSASVADGQAEASQTAFFDVSTSRSLSIAIDGELSAEEREDIRGALQVIGGLIDGFLSGDVQAIAADKDLLAELDTIARLDATVSYERNVMYGEQEKVEIRQSETDPLKPGRRRGHRRLQRLMDRMDRVTDDMMEQVKRVRGRRRRLGRSVVDLFNRYRHGDAVHAPQDRFGQEVLRTMQSTFVQKLQMLTESAGFTLSYSA